MNKTKHGHFNSFWIWSHIAWIKNDSKWKWLGWGWERSFHSVLGRTPRFWETGPRVYHRYKKGKSEVHFPILGTQFELPQVSGTVSTTQISVWAFVSRSALATGHLQCFWINSRQSLMPASDKSKAKVYCWEKASNLSLNPHKYSLLKYLFPWQLDPWAFGVILNLKFIWALLQSEMKPFSILEQQLTWQTSQLLSVKDGLFVIQFKV